LIELIMVIVILGILAATALPKFVNLSTDARTAAVQALQGSMMSTNSLIYAKAAMGTGTTGTPMGAGGTVLINGVTINAAYGFATQASAVGGLTSAMDLSPGTIVGNTTELYYAGAPTPTNCGVNYTAATSAIPSPTYNKVITGC
jgi:MSHA pilin protein MshA